MLEPYNTSVSTCSQKVPLALADVSVIRIVVRLYDLELAGPYFGGFPRV